jgi:hypothetical protein
MENLMRINCDLAQQRSICIDPALSVAVMKPLPRIDEKGIQSDADRDIARFAPQPD